jgi:hypothetical protein
MACAPFSVFRRNSRDRKTGKALIRYCARFFDEDRNVVRTKTLKATTSTKAVLEARTFLIRERESNLLILIFSTS